VQWLRKPGHTLRQAQQLPAGTLRRQETSWSSATLVQTTPGSWTPKQKRGERLKCCVQYLAEVDKCCAQYLAEVTKCICHILFTLSHPDYARPHETQKLCECLTREVSSADEQSVLSITVVLIEQACTSHPSEAGISQICQVSLNLEFVRMLKVLYKTLTTLVCIGMPGVHHHDSLQVTVACRMCFVKPSERLDLNLIVGSTTVLLEVTLQVHITLLSQLQDQDVQEGGTPGFLHCGHCHWRYG